MLLSICLFVLIQIYIQVLMWENLAFDVLSQSYAAFVFCGSFFFIACLRPLFCSLVPRIPCHNPLAAFPLKIKLHFSCAFQTELYSRNTMSFCIPGNVLKTTWEKHLPYSSLNRSASLCTFCVSVSCPDKLSSTVES